MNTESLCDKAIQRVDLAIAKHEKGEPEDLSVPLLAIVRRELESMREARDMGKFCPGYGRFILDWPDEHGLVDFLLEVEYEYKRQSRRLR